MITTPVSVGPVELPAEGLVLVAYEEYPEAFNVKVYEEEDFAAGEPLPLAEAGVPRSAQKEIAQYPVCGFHLSQALSELREMYTGWAKVERTQPLKLIGIHNEDPLILYIQFSLGERYFVYERNLMSKNERVREELFGRKHHLRQRSLNNEDEEYLISSLRFMPKAKKAISYYTYKRSVRYRRKECGR
ncbi:Hypothetical protein DEACI_0899 [Acididesulfobacillus acetoxydans]|uniref:Uncharacterized protein n=1 Tax=Acididesulfobacillus acetoxydans TaxID=1561005 RepID=A0A8S0XVD8_9FIRM|nr:hypothetical protein [Acididesulfobacillus acetoxydans]CAA7600247.1 Hypothetical protein DEACI_0899 [Acididesulfobacillus acetoxydans]CEJ09625.1 Hypothetical protein DEACI_4110 [Acididesulfobacillus acetoxydans]